MNSVEAILNLKISSGLYTAHRMHAQPSAKWWRASQACQQHIEPGYLRPSQMRVNIRSLAEQRGLSVLQLWCIADGSGQPA